MASLDRCGLLSGAGPLYPSGFLCSLGSLHGPDFLIRSWLALTFWISPRMWRARSFGVLFSQARFITLGFRIVARFAFYSFMPVARCNTLGFCDRLARCSSLGFFAEMAHSHVLVFYTALAPLFVDGFPVLAGSLC